MLAKPDAAIEANAADYFKGLFGSAVNALYASFIACFAMFAAIANGPCAFWAAVYAA